MLQREEIYFSPDYHIPNWLDPKIEQAFCAALVYPGLICSNDGFHVMVRAVDENYRLEYASSEKDLRPKADFESFLGQTNSYLIIDFMTVDTSKGTPSITKHTFMFMMLAFDDKKRYDLESINYLYKAAANRFSKILSQFPETFIHGTSYIGHQAILF